MTRVGASTSVSTQVESRKATGPKNQLDTPEATLLPRPGVVRRHVHSQRWVRVKAEESVGRRVEKVPVGDGQPPRSQAKTKEELADPSRARPLCDVNKPNHVRLPRRH